MNKKEMEKKNHPSTIIHLLWRRQWQKKENILSFFTKMFTIQLMATRNPVNNSPVEVGNVGSLSHYLQGFCTSQEFHQPYQPPQDLAGGKTKTPVQPRLRGHQRCRIDRAKPWGFGLKKSTPQKNWVDWYTHLKNSYIPLKNDGWFRCISYWNWKFFFRGHVRFLGCSWPMFLSYLHQPREIPEIAGVPFPWLFTTIWCEVAIIC